MSNRLILVDREFCHPSIDGVDFGGKTWVVARSPAAVLIWVFGHSWSVNGHQSYAAPALFLLPRLNSLAREYERLLEGGRLTAVRLAAPNLIERLKSVFGDDALGWLSRAVSPVRGAPKRTLLIEDGGGKLMPSRLGGEVQYRAWRDLPAEARGFLPPAAQKAVDRRSLGYREEENG